MIYREHYIKKIRDFYESNSIKIITGIKRSGKSVIFEQIMREIKEKTDNVIYLNFEDRRISASIKNGNALVEYVRANDQRGKCYLFLDELHLLNGWQDACRTLRRYGCSIFVAVSNSKLLSEEFKKEFNGQYVVFHVMPFVYKEILEYSKELGKDVSVADYLSWGGFPKRFEFESEDTAHSYLYELDDMLISDIVYRYKIRKEDLFHSLVDFVLSSNGKIFSDKAIYDRIKKEHGVCSVNTIMKYIGYLEEAYIIESVKQYSTKAKRELNFYTKLYNADVSLNSIRCIGAELDLSRNLENIVYNELIYMGYDVSVYSHAGKKIDLLAQMGDKKYFIQVAYSVADEDDRARKLEAFRGIDGLSQKILITNDGADYSTSTVKHIKINDFLRAADLDSISHETRTEDIAVQPPEPEVKRTPARQRDIPIYQL